MTKLPPITPRVFSGMQPTGALHLGNYLGAMVQWIKLQETHECIYCVVDLHAITQTRTVWGGPAELTQATRLVTAAYLACGLDAKNRSSSIRARSPNTRNCRGSSIVWHASDGSTG